MFSPGEPRRRTGLRTVFQERGAQSARTRLDGSCGAPRDGGPYQISWSENRYAVRKITPWPISGHLRQFEMCPKALFFGLRSSALTQMVGVLKPCTHRNCKRATVVVAGAAARDRVEARGAGAMISAVAHAPRPQLWGQPLGDEA